MKIVGILANKIIIEPQYGGDCETYVELTEKGMEELRNVFNVKQYASMEDFHADYFYGISEEEYIAKIKASIPVVKPGNIEASFQEEHINQMYEDMSDENGLPF